MQKNENFRHRKPTFANLNYKDPAIVRIYEGLSALCNDEERHDMSASSSGQPQSSVMAHFKTHPHSGIGSDKKEVAHGSGTRHFVSNYGQVEPCAVMDRFSSRTGACPLLPPAAGNNIKSRPNCPTKISTSPRFSPQTDPQDTWLPLASPPQAYHDNENHFLQRSPESLTVDSRSWPLPSSTDCSAESPTHPTRQPKGPKDAAHDTGFAWDTYKRHRYHPKAAKSLDSEPQLSQTWLTSPTLEFSGNRKFSSQMLDKNPQPAIQFQPNTSRRKLPQSENSSPSFHTSSKPTYWPIPFENGDMDVFSNQSPIKNTNQSMNFDSSAFNSQNQLVAYAPTSSGTLATMPENQGQMSSLTPTMIRSPTKPFIPSTMALTEAGRGGRDPARMPAGSKYQGDAFSRSYLRQVPGLPDHLNTSLWLKGLPPDVQPYQIFDIIQGGSIWSLDLKPPTKDHVTVAATLTFMTPYAAAGFLGHCQFHGLRLGEYWISASYNKFGIPEISTTESRVLHIEGPSNLMNPQHWELQFKKACRFQMDRWSYLPSSIPGRARMEFRFVRVDGQAQSCRQMIERELGYLGITVRYGMDPCGRIGY